MNLPDTYKRIAPSVIGFAQTLVQSPNGDKPIAPIIFATGFVVDSMGIIATNRHVVEGFPKIPKHPITGRPALAAMYCHYGRTPEGKDCIRWVALDVKYSTIVDQFSSASQWHGSDEPDIGFIQLAVRDLPALPLARHDRYVEPGMPIATAGYPMGEAALTVMKKINQMTPFVRRGIISSVFPFPIPQPHGFTIDIMQQGGSSGSPIFCVDKPEVVGMMSSSVPDYEYLDENDPSTAQLQNTNLSICVPAPQIADALATFKTLHPPKVEQLQPLSDYLATIPIKTTVEWEVFGPVQP